MEQLMILSDNTPQGNEALQLHFEIKSSLSAAASAMVDFCRQLKTMRDRKLYLHIGFESFENYVEAAQNIGQRQAYTYIQTYEALGSKLLEDNSELGITKLALLTKVSAVDRENFAQSNNLSKMSVKEIEALVQEKNGLNEQISLLQSTSKESEEKESLAYKEIERLKAQLAEKDEKLHQLEVSQQDLGTIEATAMDSEQLEKIKNDAIKAATKKFKEEKAAAIKKAEADALAKAEKEKLKAIEFAKQNAIEQSKKEFEEKNSSLISEIETVKAQSEKLQKELKISGNKDTVKFSLLFELVQRNINECKAVILAIENSGDVELATKFKHAINAILDNCKYQ